jgi:hypothetical protein
LDFTLKTYRKLLEALIEQGYKFQPFAEFLERPEARSIILRHDVEARYENALAFAQIQHTFGIRGTYYFRFLPNHFSTEIIQQIADLGHEIGYHYDDLSHCKGDYSAAIARFERNLATLNEIARVRTICMEGAPLSRYDNRDLWRKGDKETRRQGNKETFNSSNLTPHYNDYGIIGEPYFDIDFSKVFYLTDTGRRWDGGKVSVRDKVSSQQSAVRSSQIRLGTRNWEHGTTNYLFHSTSDIIAAANNRLLPDQIMFTFHPQRWADKPFPWLQELVMQNVKNVAKRVVLRFKV